MNTEVFYVHVGKEGAGVIPEYLGTNYQYIVASSQSD